MKKVLILGGGGFVGMDALHRMLEQPQGSQNQIFNIGNRRDGDATMKELAHLMRELAAEITGRSEYTDHPIEEISSGEFYGEGYEDCDRRVPDISKAQECLGWEPVTPLRETLRTTMEHDFGEYGDTAR